MSVKVNLLPREVEERILERRRITASVAGVAVFSVLLGVLYLFEASAVSRAEEERDAEQAELVVLRSRLAELEPFRRLAAELEARNTLLASAMQAEVSWSTVLNDLALVFPGNSSLLTLAAGTAVSESEPVEGEVAFGPAIGEVTFDGYTVDRYAPGVEAMLLQFDKVRAFFNVYLDTAARELLESTEVTNFSGSARIDDQAYTHRYAEGLPGEGP